MAIGHIAVRTHHRDRGHTAAAALAYRFGAALTCPRTLERHDYRRREADGEIAAKGMYAPIDTPLADSLDALAAGIETAERRKASRITRDVQIALPTELTESDRIELAREFAETIATRYGTVAAWAVHRPDDTGDERNAHAHILIPTRRLDNQGQLGAKLRVLDQKSTSHAEIKAIRALWQETANAKLRKKHIDARVDTGRTTDPAPTLGPRDTAIERRARKGRRSVSVADLVADGQSVTPRGRRLQRHERRRRKARLGPEHTAALHDTGKTLEEHRAAPVPTPRLTSIEATRATLSAGSAAPVPRAAPTAPASTRATLSAGSAAPVPQAAPTAPASTRATLSAHSAAPVPQAAPTAPASTRAALSAHSAARVPQAAPSAPVSLMETLDAVMRWTGIRALHMLDNAIQTAQAEKTHMTRRIDEIARARRRRTPAVQAHADTHGQAPTPEESATTAERLRRGFNDLVDPIARQKFFPLTVEGTPKSTIELLHSPKACQTAAGAAAASKPLDQALDQIEREESDQTRRLDSRRAALLQRWRKVRGPVIRKMVQAATGIEAIAARRRLQKPEQRDRDATARRRQVAEVPTQPAPDRGRSR